MLFFLKKVSYYFILTIIITNLILLFFLRNFPEYFITDTRDYFIVKEQYNRIDTSKDYKNIIIGDSRANTGIIGDTLGVNYVNFSIPGSTFVEGYFTLRHILRNQNIDTVIIGYGLNYLFEGNHWFDIRTIRIKNNLINFNDIKQIHKIELSNSQLIDGEFDNSIFKIKSKNQHIQRSLLFYKIPFAFKENFWNNLDKLIFKKRDRYNCLESVNFNKGNFTFPQVKISLENYKILNKHRKFNQVILNYSDSLIKLCKSNHVKAILCVPPSFIEYPDEVFKIFENQGYSVFRPLKLGFQFFSDQTHLNSNGAIRNSKYLKSKLKDDF